MIFLRHPVTDAPEGLCYGRLDLGHGPAAFAQMAAAMPRVAAAPRILSSPARRCRMVAEHLAGARPVTYDARLLEFDFGVWEGRFWTDLPRNETEHWIGDMLNRHPGGGECFADMIDRVGAALSGLDDDVLVICHAGVVRAARMLFQGQTLDQAVAVPVPYCAPVEIAPEQVPCLA